jgi:hypothetical protein
MERAALECGQALRFSRDTSAHSRGGPPKRLDCQAQLATLAFLTPNAFDAAVDDESGRDPPLPAKDARLLRQGEKPAATRSANNVWVERWQ